MNIYKMIIILICNKQRRKIVILIHNFWLITCTTKNWSLLNCVPKYPRAHVPTCFTYLRGHMQTCLACLRVNVPCVLTCSHANASRVLAVLTANVPYVLFVPTCLRAITTNNKNTFSIICFP